MDMTWTTMVLIPKGVRVHRYRSVIGDLEAMFLHNKQFSPVIHHPELCPAWVHIRGGRGGGGIKVDRTAHRAVP